METFELKNRSNQASYVLQNVVDLKITSFHFLLKNELFCLPNVTEKQQGNCCNGGVQNSFCLYESFTINYIVFFRWVGLIFFEEKKVILNR